MARKEFRLPDIGAGMVEAEVVAWRVAVGDEVEVDQPLVDIETEKSVAEIPVPYSGTIAKLGVEEGETIQVGNVLVVIEVPGAADAQVPEEHIAGATTPASTAAGPPIPISGQPVAAVPPAKSLSSKPVRRALPVARKMAEQHGIDLDTVKGSGPGGAITKADIERVVQAGETSDVEAPTSDPRARMSKMRRTIAERMERSWREIPHISGHAEVVADRLLAKRAELSSQHGISLALEALVIKALVPALAEYQEVHAWVDGEELVSYQRMDIGVAIDTPQGLIVPVVHGVDRMSIPELSNRIRELADRAVEHKLTPDEMAGNTFTVSNLGPFVSAHATQVLAPRTTGIISLGRAGKKPVVAGEGVTVASVMPLSASFDHRAVDGGMAARFLAMLMANLEQPESFTG